MRILLVEDEKPAAIQLRSLIQQERPHAIILAELDQVKTSVDFLQHNPLLDLVFMDIHLADGLAFQIFESVSVNAPIIFTTAYDQYAIRAFQENSIDYLLKPIEPEDFKRALLKFDRFHSNNPILSSTILDQLQEQLQKSQYKSSFLVKSGQQFIRITTNDIAYFYSEDGVVFARTFSNQRHMLDYSLDQLQQLINPKRYFRINRKILVHTKAIKSIHQWFKSRLKLDLLPKFPDDVVVSRERVREFKRWLGE